MPRKPKTPVPEVPDVVPPLDAGKWPAANITWRRVADLVPYARNARTHSDRQVAQIAASMREWGWTIPVLLDEKNGIIAGHGRIMAAPLNGIDVVPCMVAAGWSEAKKRAYVLADNQLAQNAGWDEELLGLELSDLQLEGFDLSLIGFDGDQLDTLLGTGIGSEGEGPGAGALAERFMLPPFTVLNAREGWWQDRKRAWLALGLRSELGRGAASFNSNDRMAALQETGDSRTAGHHTSGGRPAETEDLRGRLTHRTTLDPYRAKAKANAIPGGTPMPLDRAKDKTARKASPGGNRMPATDYSKSHAKGDGRGKAIKEASGIAAPAVVSGSVLTPIQERDGIWVKREDLWRAGGAIGGKARTCLALAQGATGLVTAGSRASPQCNIVAQVAKLLGVPCRVHTPQGELSPEVLAARAAGAEVIQHRAGYNSVIIARARADAASLGWAEIPFGMECAEAIAQTRAQVRDIPVGVKRIVMPVGSGMSLAGVLHGLQDAGLSIPVLGISVGADPTKRLNTYAPRGWRALAELRKSGSDYHAAARGAFAGARLDPYYEAKCLPHLLPGDLFWIVGIRATEAG